MNSDIERYFYHQDRVKEINKIIEGQHKRLSLFSTDDGSNAEKIAKVESIIMEELRRLYKKQEKHQKIVDNLIKKIEQETQIDGDDKKTT